MADKYPYMQFYVGDWMKDPGVSQCSPAARGIWMDLLCHMHENGQSGEITGTYTSLARACRCDADEMKAAIQELMTTETADVTLANKRMTIRCRRMVRAAKEREAGRLRQAKYRNARKSDGTVTVHSSESETESETESEKKEKKSRRMEPSADEFLEAWNTVAKRDGFKTCRNLGPSRVKSFRERRSEKLWRSGWKEALEKMHESAFLRGEAPGTRKGWRANVDFFLRPETVNKILEGLYDDDSPADATRTEAAELWGSAHKERMKRREEEA